MKLLTVCGLTLLLLSVISVLTNPLFIAVKYITRVAKGSLLYETLHHEQEGAYIYSYVFNITNADKFMSGEDRKLRVQEVGPFTYQEYRNNRDIELNTADGVLRYTPQMRSQFVPEKSLADPRGFNLTLPNVATLAVSTAVSSYPYFTRVAFDILTRRLQSQSISNLDAYSLLWGYQEPLISLAHTIMPGWIHFDKMGILDRFYDRPSLRFEVGSTDADKFKIKSINGVSGLPTRGYSIPNRRSRCNTFVDTYEGLVYPPGLTPATPIRIYRDMFCRMLDLEFVGTQTMEYGAKAFRYKLSDNVYSTGPNSACICENDCIEGVTDLSSCFYGLKAALSNGHFLHADPKLYERIEGIRPDVERHGSEFLVDPIIGFTLKTKFTIQVNIVMDNSSSNPIFKPFANMVVPIAYFKIVLPEIKEDAKRSCRIVHLYAPYALHTLEALFAITGVGLLLYVTRHILSKYISHKKNIYFQVTQNEKEITDRNITIETEKLATMIMTDQN